MTTPAFHQDLAAATRDAFHKTVIEEVFCPIPIVSMLIENGRVSWTGGEYIKRNVKTANGKSNAQNYFPNEPLTVGTASRLQTPKFGWKYKQMPLSYQVQDFIGNKYANEEERLLDIVAFITEQGQEDMMLSLQDDLWSTSNSESDRAIEGVVLALTHDNTYGGLTRATTVTNEWWQGASISGDYDDNDTARSVSLSTWRSIIDTVNKYRKRKANRLYAFCGSTIFRALQSVAEARDVNAYKGLTLARYGHTGVMLDNVEVVQDFYLDQQERDDEIVVLDPSTWEFRVHEQRNFEMTPFKWQGDVAGGTDEWLARILLAGNLVCWQPNANIYLSNLS